ncbi:serine/threonine-protein phosphatase 6 regulatory ankyrin repeat subunit B-like [Daphnia pulicaria]|uniref:serine/threonine-protein phosphatase 6 regulatory ankyrin repeat subunit B-like n=1 Tax=Daphnia pulicaria TaxID=35523 RepID=UPI001EEB9352|nr:serine/threonine-protein phosphatase 6 regulatory ankyrin repeat subunit B-like [Daphnia pulicaria]
MAKSFKSTRNLTGGDYKQKLYFVPDADNEPKVGHEISEPAIFRFLLNEETMGKFDEADEVEIVKMLEILKDIDKHSKITQVEAYRSSMMKATDTVKAYHVFIVFNSISETADDGVYCYWWSLEKSTDYITLQRSRNKENVKDKFKGKHRTRLIAEKYHIKKSNCQSLVSFVGQQITEIGYKYKGNFKYFPPPEKGLDKKMLDLINVITGYSDWSPLFQLIKMGSTDLVDKTVASGMYDINALYNGLTPLHLAIKLRKTKMVQLLLKPPMNADPTKRDASGKSALLLAASIFRMKEEIIDLLLEHDKVNVDDVNENGETALHLSAMNSNVNIFQKLLERGANPNIFDKWGQSPLHVALLERNCNEIIDLLLAHGKFNVDDVDGKGQTALHLSVRDVNIFRKLLENGANPNIYDKWGRSPLHLAARKMNGNEIMDLLLAHSKVKVDDVDGKGQTALHIAAYEPNVNVVEYLINKGANLNAVDKRGWSPLHVAAKERDGIPIIDLLLEAKKVKGIGDVNDQNKQGRTALHYAAAYSNEITAEHLIKKGANVNRRNNNGDTPLHYAALGAEDMKIIDLLLQNINEGDIQQYRNDKRLFFFARHNLHGLGNKILDRLVEKGIKPPNNETDEWTEGSDKATGINARRFEEEGVDPLIDLTGFDGLDFLIERVKKSQEIDEILKEEEFDINGRNQDGETLLLIAILGNNVNAVRLLLEKGADSTIRDERGYTPFHVAVINYTDPDILNLFLESGKVDINETTPKFGRNALHMAVTKSNTAAADFLLSKGANPNVTDKDGDTPLHVAAEYAKDMDIVELLLNHPDVDVNLLNFNGHSALDRAKNIHRLGERIANLLREKGAVERENGLSKRNNASLKKLVNYTSSYFEDKIEKVLSDATVPIEDQIARIKEEHLISAIKDSDVERVRFLLKNGADISSARGEDGNNALHLASLKAKTTDIIDAILETGKFDINGVDNKGDTCLHLAIKLRRKLFGINPDIKTRHLIRKGADPTIANKEGDTPFHLAASRGKEIETIKLILENEQVDINSRGKYGRTALHHAIEARNVITVRYLLKKGADPNAADENGVTPLHVAAIYAKSMDLIDELLLNTEVVDVNCVDIKGRTPLTYARYNKEGLGQDIIDRLKEYGAKE